MSIFDAWRRHRFKELGNKLRDRTHTRFEDSYPVVQNARYISASDPTTNICEVLRWKWGSHFTSQSQSQPCGPQQLQGLDWASYDAAPKLQNGFSADSSLRDDRRLDIDRDHRLIKSGRLKICDVGSSWRFRGEIGEWFLSRERGPKGRLSRSETGDRFGI